MNILRIIWRETVSMFVDDGSLALMAIALIAIVTALVAGLKLSPAFAEAVLPLGLGLVLIASVYRASRRSGNVRVPASDSLTRKGEGRTDGPAG